MKIKYTNQITSNNGEIDLNMYEIARLCLYLAFVTLFKHILLPKYLQQWGWVTSSHNISFDPSPTFYIYTIAYKHGYIYKRIC